MNRRDKMHPNKARWDSPEMGLAFLDGERVVAPRRAIRWPAARNEHLDALCEVADSGRCYRVNRPVVTGMEPSLEKMSTLQQSSAEHEASIGLGQPKHFSPPTMNRNEWVRSHGLFQNLNVSLIALEVILTTAKPSLLMDKSRLSRTADTSTPSMPIIRWLIGITDRQNYSLTMRPTHVHRRAIMNTLISKTATLMALAGLGDTVRLKPGAYAKYDRRQTLDQRAIPTQPCAYGVEISGRMR
ncbi:hypothetical protein ACC763_37105 [Rhizobium ruizarguesonis]